MSSPVATVPQFQVHFFMSREDVMSNRIGWLKLMLVMMAVAAMTLPSLVEASHGKKGKTGKVEGVLVSVTDTGVTIRTIKGDLVSVTADANTKVELNDMEVSLSALTVGNRAEAKFDPATMVATKIESET